MEFFYEAIDGSKIYAKHLPPKNKAVKGIIQIAHGLGETADYYEDFSSTANEAGFAVYINEARGHGRTAGDISLPEYKEKAGDAGHDGFSKMTEDMYSLTQIIKREYPDVPVFLLAHSMGSIVARLFSFKYGSEIRGLILTGAPSESGNTDELLDMIEKEIEKNGLKASCNDTFNAMFSNVNKRFEPVQTVLDWVTSDTEMAEASLKLPYTYILFNNEFYRDFLLAKKEVHKKTNLVKTPKTLPIYLLSGDNDFVTGDGKYTLKQYRIYEETGLEDVQYKIYENKRHSLLREVNRTEVANDILNWIAARI